MDDVINIAKPVTSKTKAQYGILHRPNKGPDYIMAFQSYGNNFVDPGTGKLLLERDKLAAAFGWFEHGVKQGVIPANNTRDEVRRPAQGVLHGECGLLDVWHLGSRHLCLFRTYGLPKDEAAFFADWGWIAAPPQKRADRQVA